MSGTGVAASNRHPDSSPTSPFQISPNLRHHRQILQQANAISLDLLYLTHAVARTDDAMSGMHPGAPPTYRHTCTRDHLQLDAPAPKEEAMLDESVPASASTTPMSCVSDFGLVAVFSNPETAPTSLIVILQQPTSTLPYNQRRSRHGPISPHFIWPYLVRLGGSTSLYLNAYKYKIGIAMEMAAGLSSVWHGHTLHPPRAELYICDDEKDMSWFPKDCS